MTDLPEIIIQITLAWATTILVLSLLVLLLRSRL